MHRVHADLFKQTQNNVASAHPQANITNSDGSRGWEDQSTGNSSGRIAHQSQGQLQRGSNCPDAGMPLNASDSL